eukprot:COSAG01_NODE_12838_length_1677_cov_1.322989_2_plen_186_part_01
MHHPNAGSIGGTQHNLARPSGQRDPGCILQFRVRLGACRTFTRDDPEEELTGATWHEGVVLEPTSTLQAAAAKAEAARVAEEHELAAEESAAAEAEDVACLQAAATERANAAKAVEDATARAVEESRAELGAAVVVFQGQNSLQLMDDITESTIKSRLLALCCNGTVEQIDAALPEAEGCGELFSV